MKKYLAILLFGLITTPVFAQDEYQVEMKNGSSINNTTWQYGYKGIVELGYQVGVGDYGMDRLKLDAIIGHQISPYFSLGLGTGFRYYFDAEALVVPLLADFRADFTDNCVSPYLSLGLGYSFDTTNDITGIGILLSPAMGVRFRLPNKSVIHIGVGYEMQKMPFYTYSYYDGYQEFTKNSGAMSIVIGIHR